MIGCIGQFEKVPFEVFRAEAQKCPQLQSLCENDAQFSTRAYGLYDEIQLPMRATLGSAGYDFYAPFDFTIEPGESIVIPTGICADIPDGAVLLIVPRSGSGFKYGLKLANSVAVIDSDFRNPETGSVGHIMVRLMNHDCDKPVSFSAGDGFVQGIILPFATMPDYDDEQWEIRGVKDRIGGFGSTDEQEADTPKRRKAFGTRRNH